MAPTNEQVNGHVFLQGMYGDGYFPDHLVDKGKAILLRLCERTSRSALRIAAISSQSSNVKPRATHSTWATFRRSSNVASVNEPALPR